MIYKTSIIYSLTFLVLLTFVTTLLFPWSEVTDSWTVCKGALTLSLSLVDILNIKLHFFQCNYLQNIKSITCQSL